MVGQAIAESVPGAVAVSTAGLAAVVLLYVVLAACCLLAATRRPRAGRITAVALVSALALGAIALAGVIFAESQSPEQIDTFGEQALGLVGSIVLLAGLVLGGLAFIAVRGGDEGRWLVAVALGVIGYYSVKALVHRLATEGATVGQGSLSLVALTGLAGVAGAALLVGGSDAVGRWSGRISPAVGRDGPT